jgi:hypothetical protein
MPLTSGLRTIRKSRSVKVTYRIDSAPKARLHIRTHACRLTELLRAGALLTRDDRRLGFSGVLLVLGERSVSACNFRRSGRKTSVRRDAEYYTRDAYAPQTILSRLTRIRLAPSYSDSGRRCHAISLPLVWVNQL